MRNAMAARLGHRAVWGASSMLKCHDVVMFVSHALAGARAWVTVATSAIGTLRQASPTHVCGRYPVFQLARAGGV
jgi:hypothetical protein